MKRLLMGVGKADLAIDFGTANTRVVTSGGGVLFDEPSLCCFAGEISGGELVAVGTTVRSMVNRTSGALRIVRPLHRGVLSDIAAARDYLAYAVRSSVGQRRFRSFRAIIGVPADATGAERGALLTAAKDAGLGSVELVAEPLAAALGAGLSIDRPRGCMIIECGAGVTEAVIISLGGMCEAASIRGGGNALDAAISDYLHIRHKFLVGANTAEQVKRDLVRILEDETSATVEISLKGRSLVTGLPGAMSISATELAPVVEKQIAAIAGMVVTLLARANPELSRDIHGSGVILTGGSAAIGLVGKAVAEATGLDVSVADEHAHCVALGLQRALAH